MAVDVLKSKGVPEDRILFINLIASPEGARSFADKYPKVRVVTAFVDQGLNEKKYVMLLRFVVVRCADRVSSASSCRGLGTLVIDFTRCNSRSLCELQPRFDLLACTYHPGAPPLIPALKSERTDSVFRLLLRIALSRYLRATPGYAKPVPRVILDNNIGSSHCR